MTEFSLSTTVLSADGDRLYTFEYAALVDGNIHHGD
jgi:hypothetical protein